MEDFARKRIDPRLHAGNRGIEEMINVGAFRKETTDDRILCLVRAAVPGAVRVCVVDASSG